MVERRLIAMAGVEAVIKETLNALDAAKEKG